MNLAIRKSRVEELALTAHLGSVLAVELNLVELYWHFYSRSMKGYRNQVIFARKTMFFFQRPKSS